MKIVSRDRWFEVRSLSDGIRLIHEPYIRPFYRCNLWHIQGRDRDLLLDSGSGLVSLREQLPWLTERPLLAVASHCHFDHIAGHHEFPERLVHPAEAQILAAPDGANTLSAAFVGDAMFEAHPDCPLCYAEYRVKAAPATRLIEEGDVLDLGNRSLQVLHTPGHSPGDQPMGSRQRHPVQWRHHLRRPTDRRRLPLQSGGLRRQPETPVRAAGADCAWRPFRQFFGSAAAQDDRGLDPPAPMKLCCTAHNRARFKAHAQAPGEKSQDEKSRSPTSRA